MGGGLKQASFRSFFGRGKPKGSTDGSLPTPPDPYENLAWAAGSSEYMVKGSGSHELEAQYIGEGTPTFDTPAGLLLPDHEGVYYEIEEDTAPWHGARAVVQQAPKTNALDTWLKAGATVATGIADPDGGNTAVRVTSTASQGALRLTNIKDFPAGSKVRASWWIRRVAGTANVQIYNGNSADLFTVPVTSDWTRVTADVADASGLAYMGVWLNALDDAVDVWHPMYEIVTGQANQNPSEYVENTSIFNDSTASKFYSNANGNTVTSNVVTEAVGAPLAVAPSLYAAPAMTNNILYSNDLTNAAWLSNAATSFDQVGLTGESNTATLVTDDSAAAAITKRQRVTIPDDSNTHTVRVFVAKDANQSRFPRLLIDLENGSGPVIDSRLNTATGAVGNNGEANAIGDWWEWMLEIDNDSTGNTSLDLQIYAAFSNTLTGSQDATLLDSIIIGNAEVHLNKTIAQVRGSAPIITAGTAVTNSTVLISYDIANLAPDRGAMYAQWMTYSWDSVVDNLAVLSVDASNLLSGTTSSSSWSARNNGTWLPNVNVSPPTEAGVWYGIGTAYDLATTELGLRLTTSAWTENTSFVSWPTTGALKAIRIINSSNAISSPNLIRNLQNWDLDYQSSKDKVDELIGS